MNAECMCILYAYCTTSTKLNGKIHAYIFQISLRLFILRSFLTALIQYVIFLKYCFQNDKYFHDIHFKKRMRIKFLTDAKCITLYFQ